MTATRRETGPSWYGSSPFITYQSASDIQWPMSGSSTRLISWLITGTDTIIVRAVVWTPPLRITDEHAIRRPADTTAGRDINRNCTGLKPVNQPRELDGQHEPEPAHGRYRIN